MEQSLLHKYFKGETSIEDEKRILDWIDESEENRHTFQNERLLYDIALFSTAKKRTASRFISIMKWSVAAAAMITLVFMCGYWFSESSHNELYTDIQTITVPAGQRAHLTLADGTSVWLNSKSTLKYASNFGKKERNVELNGEAYFEVSHNKEIPFYVHTERNKIRVVGTTFNVCAYAESDEFNTFLLEGIVDIYKGESEEKLTRLEKDQYLAIIKGSYQKGIIKSKDFLRWREGIYCFDDVPFADLLKKLELYYDMKIIINSAKILDYKCTGKFKQQDGIEHVLKVIQKDHYFQYSFNKDRDTITLK